MYWRQRVIPEGAVMDTILLKTDPDSTEGSQRDRAMNIPKSTGWQIRAHSHVWSPPTDLYETEDKYVVRVEVAGLRDQDFSVTLDNNYLVVSGSRPDVLERRAYHQMEIRFGEFSTVVALPSQVDSDQTIAEYSDGFLVVMLPKKNKK
jgi:HSP20 family protein